MKKRIVMLGILFILICSAGFATVQNDYVNQKVLAAFTAQFASAREISWNKTDKYLKATFTINDQCLFAYFFETGELIGISRNITSIQLPIKLNAALKDYMVNGWIAELSEFASKDETAYFATIENAREKIMIKSLGTSEWTVYKKVKKTL